MNENVIICGDCLEVMKDWPDGCVDLVVTSPPYWGLRDYGSDGQIGLEKTPEKYIDNLARISGEILRILKEKSTYWLNLGDSYVSGKGRYSSCPQIISKRSRNEPCNHNRPDQKNHPYLKDKDLAMIPARVAIELQKQGWWLRNDIIWYKPNPMPESVTDRCTKSHEHIFLLSNSPDYYYDHEAIKEDSVDPESFSGRRFRSADRRRTGLVKQHFDSAIHKLYEKRNRRDVWVVNVKNNNDGTEHYAQYPEELITSCILAGSRPGAIILDPFSGSGTTCVAAKMLGRRYIGIDISEEYCQIARDRLRACDTGVPVKEARAGQGALFQ